MTERIIDRRCIHCKKWKEYHRATDGGCPLGRKHRVLGYMQYSEVTVYEPNMRAKPRTSKLTLL